ncbi:MAG: FMN-binding protein [Jatrophihabitantaceae bacterium]
MRRVLLSIVGTIAGLGALLSFKTHSAASHPLPVLAGPKASTSTSAPANAGPSSSAPPQPGRSATATPSASAASSNKTVAGQAIETRYGIVQVQVVLTGHSIKDVSFLQLTANDPRSADINSQAAPMLVQQTIQAQSANIDGVSGATYTSEGFLQSLQSALSQAGF